MAFLLALRGGLGRGAIMKDKKPEEKPVEKKAVPSPADYPDQTEYLKAKKEAEAKK